MCTSSSWFSSVILVLLVALLVLYKYMTRHFSYWKERGVYNQPPLPFLGNTIDVFSFKYSLGQWLKMMSDTIDKPYFGLFVFDRPSLVITDPELFRYILIKDFNVFRNRSVASGDHHEIMRELMFFQKDPPWKAARTNFASLYTSGKLKRMFALMNEVAAEFIDHLEANLGDIDDIKPLMTGFTLELISRTTFGLKPDSFKNKNSEFLWKVNRLFENTVLTSFYQLCFFFKQEWVEPLRLTFFPSDALRYFTNLFLHTSKSRKNGGVKGNDLIDIIAESKRNGQINLSDEILAACALQIFVAGFETTSTTISFLVYELARHPQIQTRLRREITEAIKKHGGITYEALSEMKYLEQCIFESLRKYPTLPFLDRCAAEDYELPGTDLIIEKGMSVYIPIYAIHFNEKYFPEPYKFNPDRFEGGRDSYREALKFIAFGAGPRICLGERYGILACKTCICHLLTNIEVLSNEKTQKEIQFSTKSQLTLAIGGLPMRFRKYVPGTE